MVKSFLFLVIFSVPIITIGGEIYSPRNCNFSVALPVTPKYVTGYLPQSGEYKIAEMKIGTDIDGLALKVECVPVTDEQFLIMNTKEYMLQKAESYVLSNGFSNPEYRFQETSLGKNVSVRAFKNISNISVIYEVHMYLGHNSFLSVYAGGAAKSYPQAGAVETFNSVKLK